MSAGLGRAVKRLDYPDIKKRFLQYNKVSQNNKLVVSKGLVKRRHEEIQWLFDKNTPINPVPNNQINKSNLINNSPLVDNNNQINKTNLVNNNSLVDNNKQINKTDLINNNQIDNSNLLNNNNQTNLVNNNSLIDNKNTLLEVAKTKTNKLLKNTSDIIKKIDEESLKLVQNFLSENKIMSKSDNIINNVKDKSNNLITNIDRSSLKMVQNIFNKKVSSGDIEIIKNKQDIKIPFTENDKSSTLSKLITKKEIIKKVDKKVEPQPIININNNKDEHEPHINLYSSRLMNESLSLIGNIL